MGTKTLEIYQHTDQGQHMCQDQVAVEEPLEICVVTQEDGVRVVHHLAITMRTPGHDPELALGFLLTEGAIKSKDDIASLDHGTDPDGIEMCNRIEVLLQPGVPFDATKYSRHVFTSSSCGICGKITIENIQAQGLKPLEPSHPPSADVWMALPERLRQHQALFEATGGLHAAALFDKQGQLVAVREDVGRHNALDKLLGHMLLNHSFPGSDHLLMLSGRASFELIQKAITGGIPYVAAVGAPSSLAVELACEFGIHLVGFLRNHRFNVYAPCPT